MSARSLPEWERAFRSLEHGRAWKACKNLDALKNLPKDFRKFARIFLDAQLQRALADYALNARCSRIAVIELFEIARNAVRNLKRYGLQTRRAFLAHVALPDRGL